MYGMTLNSEWRARVESWIKALDQLTYAPAGAVALEAYFTYEQLTARQAEQCSYAPLPAGSRWGRKWEYAWFRGRIRVPEALQGQPLVLNAGERTAQFGGDQFGEWRVFVDGLEIGSRDWAHVYLHLPEKSPESDGTTEYSLLIEAFGGPTRAGPGGGPALDGVPTLPEPPELQRVLPAVTFGVWKEAVFQLAMDARTLLDLRDQLPKDSLRVAQIDTGLCDFTLIADPELKWAQMEPTIHAARERLRPLLDCTNGTTAPVLFCVGHSHLDVVYQWPLKEAERKVARTFSNQLTLMQRYPEYRYLQSMPVLYDIAKRLHPHIYHRIRDAVKQGQWIPEGGMWTEADVNLPGGESLVRQFLYGRRFFYEEFGVQSTFAWLPDSFGYTGALPQIMVGCGMKAFGSSKMFSVFGQSGDPFPYSTFWWEGIDGTRILTHFVANYGITTNPAQLAEQWQQNPQKTSLHARMAVYGHSDGGGGCEREHLEYLRRAADLEGLPRCRHATPAEFFEYQQAQNEELPTYAGEIYMPAHRGCYTTYAALKRGNRRCENGVREAEMWATLAHTLKGAPYPAARLEAVWKKILFNQFHDILPGTCIERAAQEALEQYDEAFTQSMQIANAAMQTLVETGAQTSAPDAGTQSHGSTAQKHDCAAQKNASEADNHQSKPAKTGRLVVFNSLPWQRTELIPLNGQPPPASATTQVVDGTAYVEASMPACGWAELGNAPSSLPDGTLLIHSANDFENELYRVRLDSLGRISSWFDKESSRELVKEPLNDLRMFRDTPYVCDAWEIEAHYMKQPVPLDTKASITLISSGPLAVVVRIERRLNNSMLVQDIWLRRGAKRIEFRTRIDWNEKHKLLKAYFPLAITASEALHEIQYGYLKRPTHRSRPFDRDRFEVCQQRWSALAEENRGVALLNDCKYGISAEGSRLGLTLLRAPQAPSMRADIGRHEFTYALTAWNGSFAQSAVTREAMALNTPPQVAHGSGSASSFFSCDAENVVIDSVKLSEDGQGDIIVRLYESTRTTTRCKLQLGFFVQQAFTTNMLEQVQNEIAVTGNELEFELMPFEIKTFRLSPSPGLVCS